MTIKLLTAAVSLFFAAPALTVSAQEMPADYAAVLKSLDRQGDYKDNVLKVNIPRNDLKVVVEGVATPTPFGIRRMGGVHQGHWRHRCDDGRSGPGGGRG